ncbi:YqgQ family protein [Alteribacillus iranensis]|uniref:Uncharacterized protein YqgQ n=1 Tax=Alteribacillus iranensis TaxID=930128 RepID=A0A1I1ZEG5_9BACI|nr:YqgQ family protein [Alteribacillus iranensis]SFE29982.1 Uncharacterized protein YqgQ [Alteribacillus iranensis]
MDTIAGIRKWLMQFRTVIYTKDRQLDLDIMEEEIRQAFEVGLLEKEMYMKALLTIQKERREL